MHMKRSIFATEIYWIGFVLFVVLQPALHIIFFGALSTGEIETSIVLAVLYTIVFWIVASSKKI